MGGFIPLQRILDVSSCSARGEELRNPQKGDSEHEDFVRMERGVNPPTWTIQAGAVKVRPFPSSVVGGYLLPNTGKKGLHVKQ